MLKIPKLRELSFLVYGLGLSGRSTVNFFKKKNIKNFSVWDDNRKHLFKSLRAKDLRQTLDNVDFIVLAPGISLNKNKILNKFKDKIITDIDLFFLINKNCKSIVVTGTNGKSTTCKLIEHLLKKNKYKCRLGGNIGTPILNLKNFNNSYVIIEASSFQLSHSKFIRPNYAFFINITNDHLDWHGSKKNYLSSKLKIFGLQGKNHFAIIPKSIKRIFKIKKFLSKPIINEHVKYNKRIKLKIKNGYLSSKINDENMSFVYSFSKLLKIKEKNFISAMQSFSGLPHRFEIFLKKRGIIFINDSKATTFEATQSALTSLKNIYWIVGGQPKNGDKIKFSNFKKNIIKCYIIGHDISFFKKQIKGKLDFLITKNLKNSICQILKDIKFQNNEKKSILLSPSAASFDQFENFEERGNEFKRLCKKYARKLN
tara:strand:- start:73 stop:1353 length:1281 start_codon:yes stop_codon:yes gene_type:complete